MPFKEVCERSAEDQDYLDIRLDEAMKEAQGAAGHIINLGTELVQSRPELISTITLSSEIIGLQTGRSEIHTKKVSY